MKKDKTYLALHNFLMPFVKFAVFIYSRIFLGYKCKGKYKIKKGEKVLILSNHQTDFDPFLILLSFNRPYFSVSTDSILTGKNGKRLMKYLAIIPKKKGAVDIRFIKKLLEVTKEGRSVLLFPEGNRSYAEFQYEISLSLVGLIRKIGCNLVLFNFHGGNGVSPRFGKKLRRGKFYGEIKKVVTTYELKGMTDEEVLSLIKENLKVFDSLSGEKYKSRRRAEYLERMLFACPICEKHSTLFSKGENILCSNCGNKVEFTEDLHLSSDNPKFEFTKLLDWWNYDKKWIREREFDGEIFADENVSVSINNPFEKVVIVAKKERLLLTKDKMTCGNFEIELKDIENSTVVSGTKLIITANGNDYKIKGGDRFNPVKYALVFNKLETGIKSKKSDIYFNLEDD